MAGTTDKVERLNWPPELGSSGGSLNHWVDFHAFSFKGHNKTLECALYIPPDALSTGYKAEYKNLEMGQAGKAAADAAQKADGTIDGMTAGVAAAATSHWNMGLKGIKEMMTNIAPETAQAFLMRNEGSSTNPYMVTQYQGPTSHRTHKFTFQMMPKSRVESKTVANIVKQFKLAMHPDHTNADSEISPSGMFGYPDEFEITFFINGKPQDGADNGLFKIGRSALTDVGVDYTTQDTVAFFHDADYPVSVEMTLEFQEIWLMHRGLIRKGY